MVEIWLWNSIATRKRAPSDGFLENGLGILKSSAESQNHKVKVIDWQKNEFYNKLCPESILKLNYLSTKFLFSLSKKNPKQAMFYYPLYQTLQNLVDFIRKQKMKSHLEKFANEIIKNKIKILGTKIWYGEAYIWSEYLAGLLRKKDSSILLIAGGFHVTLYEENLMKKSNYDLGVIAEGEQTLNQILAIADNYSENWNKNKILKEITKKADKNEIKNLVYKTSNEIKISKRAEINMKNKPIPKYSQSDLDNKLRIHVLLDSLGCPWGKCNFCVHNHFYQGFHPRPIPEIIKEIKYLLSKNVSLFRFAGSETPPYYGAKIAKQILKNKLKIRYSTGCRAVKDISKNKKIYNEAIKNFEIMIKSGLRAIFMGGETGNNQINKEIMNKGVIKNDIIYTIKAFKQAQKNIKIQAYISIAFIYPCPTSNEITLNQIFKDNLNLIKESKPDSVIITPAGPFKNTEWYNQKEKFQFKLGKNFIDSMMQYEYVIYKPPKLWPNLGNIKLGNMNFIEYLEECKKMREAVESLGIPTDLTDEFFLMIDALEYKGKSGLKRFKNETSIDLVSSYYPNIERMTIETNKYSKKLARENEL